MWKGKHCNMYKLVCDKSRGTGKMEFTNL